MKTRILLAATFFCAALVASAGAADPEPTPTPATSAPTPIAGEISDTETRIEPAKVLTYDKKYEEAIEAYRQVLATDPDNIEAKIGLAEVLYYSGKSDEATAALKGIPEEKLDEKGKMMVRCGWMGTDTFR